MSIRLNKLLARRGIGARRKCDLLIQEGRVRINGKIVREPGTMVEEQRDRIEVEGRPLPRPAEHRYYVLNKPVGVISTLSDPEGRRTVSEFLPPGPRLFPVGRLDADTSGLLMLTNDGELAHRLMHPRYGVEKVYRAWLDRTPTGSQLDRLRNGVEFEPGIVSEPARVRMLEAEGGQGLIEISIHEGRYRQVRRMCEAVGLRVTGLHRWAYGPIRLGAVERGMWRELSHEEVMRLRSASARPRPRGRPIGEFFSARRGLVRSRRQEGEAGTPSRPRAPRGSAPARSFERGTRDRRPRPEGEGAAPRPFDRGVRGTRPRDEGAGSRRFERGVRATRPRDEGQGAMPRRFERGVRATRPRDEGAGSRRFERVRATRPRDEGAMPRRFDRGVRATRPRDEGQGAMPRRFERGVRDRRPRDEGAPRRSDRDTQDPRPRGRAEGAPRRFERGPRDRRPRDAGERTTPRSFERAPREGAAPAWRRPNRSPGRVAPGGVRRTGERSPRRAELGGERPMREGRPRRDRAERIGRFDRVREGGERPARIERAPGGPRNRAGAFDRPPRERSGRKGRFGRLPAGSAPSRPGRSDRASSSARPTAGADRTRRPRRDRDDAGQMPRSGAKTRGRGRPDRPRGPRGRR